jgi:hypothetical protein
MIASIYYSLLFLFKLFEANYNFIELAMSNISKEALSNRPKRPLSGYFKFRMEKLVEYKDDDDKIRKIKIGWNKLDEKEKEKLSK